MYDLRRVSILLNLLASIWSPPFVTLKLLTLRSITWKLTGPVSDLTPFLFRPEREERVHLEGGSEKYWDEGGEGLLIVLSTMPILVVGVGGGLGPGG
jgi:hypothetical protein